jgi:uncharacterized membrane protein YcaP (DUF421 family)
MVVATAVGIYASVLILTRIAGLRSFAKLSGFDFAMTVAIGSLIASAIITPDPPLLQAAAGLVAIYALQISVAIFRQRSAAVRDVVDNTPLLLMDGSRVLHDNLREARVTEADLRAKLREANVLRTEEIRAVVMETTGDVSVLHGDADGPELEPGLLEGVDRGSR